MVQLKFYNSRSKKIDTFVHDRNVPINMYTCGPTVYDRVHLGNLKTFLWSDFVVSFLNAIGYKTNHIMNITDIDDKIINRLPEQTMDALIKFTSYYTDKFLEDVRKLGLRNYTKNNIYKVTDSADDMEEMIIDLIKKDCAYKVEDGSVYFDSTKIKNNPFYIENDIEGYESARNIIRSDGIRSNRDFVLWKVKDEETLKWGKTLAKGRISWDPECTCLCAKYLGKVHIKMGGLDLKEKHHKNSISQSEALYPDQVYGDYWIHFGFLNFSGDKMSKSLGNVKRLDDVKHNYKLLRLYLFSKSYKYDFDYSEDEIEILKKDFINIHLFYNKLKNKFYKQHKNDKSNYSGETSLYEEVLEIVANNFDTNNAFKTIIKYVDKLMKVYLTEEKANNIIDELDKINNLFNILDNDLLKINDETLNIVLEREELRRNKEFKRTDEIRDELKKNYIFEDDNTGYTLIKKL